MILERPPDLVITDVDMPFMTGYEFVAALKGDRSTDGIPVIFLAAHDDVDEHSKTLGAVAYFRKPISADRLLEVVGLYMPPTPHPEG